MKYYLFALSLFLVAACSKDKQKPFTCTQGIVRLVTTRDTILMANALTPNGDGKNDVVSVLGATSRLRSFEMSVYNQGDTLLFSTTDFNKGWDGISSSNYLQKAGTYVVKLKFATNDTTFESSQCVTLYDYGNGSCIHVASGDYFTDQFDPYQAAVLYPTQEKVCP